MKLRTKIISTMALSLALTGVVSAQTANQVEVKQKVQALRQEIQEKKLANCDKVESRVEAKVKKFEENKEKKITSYNKTKTKIQNLIDKLAEQGYDVSKLKEDLVTYDSKIKKFSNDYATYITLLKETKSYTCGRSEGEFKAKLEAARAQLKIVHDDAVDIRTFFAKTVKQDALALKEQKQNNENEDE